jgi:hypothetical protein
MATTAIAYHGPACLTRTIRAERLWRDAPWATARLWTPAFRRCAGRLDFFSALGVPAGTVEAVRVAAVVGDPVEMFTGPPATVWGPFAVVVVVVVVVVTTTR